MESPYIIEPTSLLVDLAIGKAWDLKGKDVKIVTLDGSETCFTIHETAYTKKHDQEFLAINGTVSMLDVLIETGRPIVIRHRLLGVHAKDFLEMEFRLVEINSKILVRRAESTVEAPSSVH